MYHHDYQYFPVHVTLGNSTSHYIYYSIKYDYYYDHSHITDEKKMKPTGIK